MHSDAIVACGVAARALLVGPPFSPWFARLRIACCAGQHIELATADPDLQASARTQLDATEKGPLLARQLLALGGGPSNTRTAPHRGSALVRSTADLYRASAPPGVRVAVLVYEDGAIDADTGQMHQAVQDDGPGFPASGVTPESAAGAPHEGAFLQKPNAGGDVARALPVLVGQG